MKLDDDEGGSSTKAAESGGNDSKDTIDSDAGSRAGLENHVTNGSRRESRGLSEVGDNDTRHWELNQDLDIIPPTHTVKLDKCFVVNIIESFHFLSLLFVRCSAGSRSKISLLFYTNKKFVNSIIIICRRRIAQSNLLKVERKSVDNEKIFDKVG